MDDLGSLLAGAGIVGLMVGLLGLACLVFWVWMLIHAIRNKGLRDTEKIIWVLVIVLVQVLGALIYFFVGRPKARG